MAEEPRTRNRERLTDYENTKFDQVGAVRISKPALITKVDEPNATETYVGESILGTNVASTGWRIKKITIDGNVTTISYADGEETFDKIWDDRTGYTY